MNRINLIVTIILLQGINGYSFLKSQNTTLGLEVPFMVIEQTNHTKPRESGILETQKQLNYWSMGIFGDRTKESLYLRMSLGVNRTGSEQVISLIMNDSSKVWTNQAQSSMGSTLGLEIGKNWDLSRRISFRTGITTSYSLGYGYKFYQLTEYYEKSLFANSRNWTQSGNITHNASAGISLRMQYNISTHFVAGLAMLYKASISFGKRTFETTYKELDSQQGVLNSFSGTIIEDYKGFNFGNPIRPCITLGYKINSEQ